MQLSDIKLQGKPFGKAKVSEVDRLEKEYWFTFPAGYREYVTTFGDGLLASFIRIYPPARIANELEEWRDRIRQYWFWDAGAKVLPKDRALECVIIGDTIQGDEIVFHPCRPERIFILPRHEEKVFDAGTELLAAIEWICKSGKISSRLKERDFQPHKESASPLAAASPASIDPPGESLKELIAACERWAKRHNFINESEQFISTSESLHLNIPWEQINVVPQRCSLVFKESKARFESPGFFVEMQLIDRKSGLEIGYYEYRHSVQSRGGSFARNEKNRDQLITLYGERRPAWWRSEQQDPQ